MVRILLLLSFLLFPTFSYAQEACVSEMQAGKNGWVFRPKKDYLEDFKITDDLVQNFQKLDKAFKAQGVELIVVMLPTRGMLHYDQIIKEGYDVKKSRQNYQRAIDQLRKSGLNAVMIKEEDYHPEFYHKTDHHWSALGAKIVVEKTANIIKNIPTSQEIETVEYKTELAETQKFTGRFAETLKEDCDNDVEAENIETFQTYSINNTNLLVDSFSADVVLIGTSNSDNNASKANFAGALRQALSMDVDNHSISGGGYDTAMIQYLSSDDYKDHKPKFIVWEFPIYQDFWDERFYKQIIPTTYGACNVNALFTKNVDINDNKFEVHIGDFSYDVDKVYIHINMPGFKEKRFRLLITDQNDKVSAFEFERSKYFTSNGEFFLDIEKDKNLKTFKGLLPETNAKNLQLSICAYPK